VDCADSYFENGFFLCNHCGERVDLWRASVDQAIRLRNISDSALISLGARQSWLHLRWPRAETPTHFITMGLHEDLNEATKLAVREMIDFLMNERHLSRNDAYMLSSVTADLHITELVDGNKGVHMMIPKAIFVSAQPK
jgi:acetamidase/formamidase